MSPSTRYITLSHRWGISDVLKLLGSNLESMMASIDFSALPIAFQDAITITRFLGIQYIWVDSLCIIQDSISDWTKEAGNMCHIYKYAYCTVAATSTKEKETRCFWDRDVSSMWSLEVDFQYGWEDILAKGSYFIRIDTELLFPRSVDIEPLHSRGWVVQERFLSRCVLHFTDSQVFFECSKMRCSEMYPDGLPMPSHSSFGSITRGELCGIDSNLSVIEDPVQKRFRLHNL
jgi:hypothetical protein